jgi:diguanylate cyclase (GGDEF)-like protein/PAS domain S-box-containing protein
MGLMGDALRSRAVLRWAVLLSGVGILAALVVGATVDWTAALVVVIAIALGAASCRVFLYLSLHSRFDALDHLAHEAVLVLDEADRVLYASPSAKSILGVPVDRLAGWSLDFVHPDDLERLVTAYREARRTPGGTFLESLRVGSPTTGWRWIEVASTNQLDDPRIGGVVSTIRDITDWVTAEEAVRATSERFHELVANLAEVLMICDSNARVTFASPSLRPSIGLDPEEIIGVDLTTFVHPHDAALAVSVMQRVLSVPGGGEHFEVRVRRVDGQYIEVEVGLQNMLHNPAVNGLVVHARDVTARKAAERDAERFRSIFENTSDVVVLSDADRRPIFINAAARRTMGLGPDVEINQIDQSSYFTEASWHTLVCDAHPAALRDGVWKGDLDLRRPADGLVVPVSHVLLAPRNADGEVEFFASVSRDMTDQKRLEARLQHQADHDELTGLPSRIPLISYLEVALTNTHRFGGRVAVLFLDLDLFKVVNDSLGHQSGDQLLVEVAKLLLSVIRPQDRAGRFGGDEFVVILPDVQGAAEAVEIADRIRTEVGGRFVIGSGIGNTGQIETVFATVSIGVALAVGDESPEELLRDADAAMYEAKARGRDRVQLFDGAMRLQVVERLDIEQALRKALDEDELTVYYQPVIDLSNGHTSGVEALVRWEHPTRGLLLPGQFLPVAEETGLIVDLGTWVLRRACEESLRWGAAAPGAPLLPVFVNLSARQLADPDLVPNVRQVLALTGVDPSAVHLEITEDALMTDRASTTDRLHDLRGLGLRLAIDDFGTGYSSLSYLKHFPVDILKIDKSFVDGLGSDAGDAAITAAIVEVAHRFGLQTIAEGIERVDQAEWLTALGCDLGQGHHYALPMPDAQLRAYLHDLPLHA